MKAPRVIVVLDYSNIEDARQLVDQLDPSLCRLKIGKTMFTRYGPEFVKELIQRGYSVFLDLKFHDIPQQVAGACLAAAELGVWMVNVHIAGGRAMLEASVEKLKTLPKEQRPLLIGVTILTSLNEKDCQEVGISGSVKDMVLKRAQLAHETGLDGVVCSPQEVTLIREHLPHDFLTVTPGIRLANDAQSDQKRIMTPEAAIKAGASYLVIGRSITQSKNSLATLNMINESISLV